MSRLVQTAPDSTFDRIGRHFQHVATTIILCLLLSGCGAAGLTIDDAATDRSIQTGSVSTDRGTADETLSTSDATTIQNAVSSADLDRIGDTGVAWANAHSGNSGLVIAIEEQKKDGKLCRIFTTRKQSYDGVGLHTGVICLGSDGDWRLLVLEPV